MECGSLRHSVEIQSFTTTRDAFGQASKQWGTDATVWAAIEALQGREALVAAQINGQITHKVTIRYRADVTRKCRIKFGTRIFDINVVKNVAERNEVFEMLCTEKV